MFKTGSHCVTVAGFELVAMVLLLCWCYRHSQPHPEHTQLCYLLGSGGHGDHNKIKKSDSERWTSHFFLLTLYRSIKPTVYIEIDKCGQST